VCVVVHVAVGASVVVPVGIMFRMLARHFPGCFMDESTDSVGQRVATPMVSTDVIILTPFIWKRLKQCPHLNPFRTIPGNHYNGPPMDMTVKQIGFGMNKLASKFCAFYRMVNACHID
jgi:hypothetical protein